MDYSIDALFDIMRTAPPYPGHYDGRGIVISAGGPYLPSAYLAVRSLREAGSRLPIQLWYLGAAELPQPLHPLFSAHGVELVDALQVQKIFPTSSLSGWQTKPYALHHSRFREVLSFDADNLALSNPDLLFETEIYKQQGALFWPDFPATPNDYWAIKARAWELLRLTPKNGAELESGQLIVDKQRCWHALSVALHMNEQADYFYTHCTYGDKDTYALAWDLMKIPVPVIPHRPRPLEDSVRLQFDATGRELFQHSRKWVLPADKNPQLPSYRLQEKCFGWLREFERGFNAITRSE